MNADICHAIRDRRLLYLVYHWGHRVVEPHAYGRNANGHELLRAYQLIGESQSQEMRGWKLLRVDEIHSLTPLPDHFSGPRSDYHRGDKALNAAIYCEL